LGALGTTAESDRSDSLIRCAQLIDLDRALCLDESETGLPAKKAGPTGGWHKGFMVGTLVYMAPELLRKERTPVGCATAAVPNMKALSRSLRGLGFGVGLDARILDAGAVHSSSRRLLCSDRAERDPNESRAVLQRTDERGAGLSRTVWRGPL